MLEEPTGRFTLVDRSTGRTLRPRPRHCADYYTLQTVESKDREGRWRGSPFVVDDHLCDPLLALPQAHVAIRVLQAARSARKPQRGGSRARRIGVCAVGVESTTHAQKRRTSLTRSGNYSSMLACSTGFISPSPWYPAGAKPAVRWLVRRSMDYSTTHAVRNRLRHTGSIGRCAVAHGRCACARVCACALRAMRVDCP